MSPAHLFVALKPINPLSCRFTAPEVIYRLQTASRTLCNEHSTPPPPNHQKTHKKKKDEIQRAVMSPGLGTPAGWGRGSGPGSCPLQHPPPAQPEPAPVLPVPPTSQTTFLEEKHRGNGERNSPHPTPFPREGSAPRQPPLGLPPAHRLSRIGVSFSKSIRHQHRKISAPLQELFPGPLLPKEDCQPSLMRKPLM